MRFLRCRFVFLALVSLMASGLSGIAQTAVAGRWQCTGTGLDAETISFRLELKQSGTSLSGFFTVGDDEVPIREGKLEGNRIELITFADDKEFTTVAAVEGNELKGSWKDDTGRSGTWQGKRVADAR